MGAIAEVIASLVQVILQFLPKDSPCPICSARQAEPVATAIAIAAANATADALEKAKFPDA